MPTPNHPSVIDNRSVRDSDITDPRIASRQAATDDAEMRKAYEVEAAAGEAALEAEHRYMAASHARTQARLSGR